MSIDRYGSSVLNAVGVNCCIINAFSQGILVFVAGYGNLHKHGSNLFSLQLFSVGDSEETCDSLMWLLGIVLLGVELSVTGYGKYVGRMLVSLQSFY